MPLGLCDYRSFNWERDLITLKLVYPNSTGETFMVANNPAHKWYYLKGMAPNEAVLFKWCASSCTFYVVTIVFDSGDGLFSPLLVLNRGRM